MRRTPIPIYLSEDLDTLLQGLHRKVASHPKSLIEGELDERRPEGVAAGVKEGTPSTSQGVAQSSIHQLQDARRSTWVSDSF